MLRRMRALSGVCFSFSMPPKLVPVALSLVGGGFILILLFKLLSLSQQRKFQGLAHQTSANGKELAVADLNLHGSCAVCWQELSVLSWGAACTSRSSLLIEPHNLGKGQSPFFFIVGGPHFNCDQFCRMNWPVSVLWSL